MAISPILILFAHPAIERSRINQPMINAVAGLEGVTIHDLYEAYPDFDIDVSREQALVEVHDVVVFHHPMRWYSCPALLKEWFDLVLTEGWAYGSGAVALRGKRAVSAVSTGGSTGAFTPDGASRHVVEDFLLPFDQTVHLCGMTYLEPVIFHGSHRATEIEISAHARAYRARILSLRDGSSEGGG